MKKLLPSNRFTSFSAKGQHIIAAGLDLYKHYLYNTNKDRYSKYSENAQNGLSYEEKEKTFNKNLIDEAIRQTGLNIEVTQSTFARHTVVRDSLFALVSEVLATIIPETILDQFANFAEVRNVAWGDNLNFRVPTPGLFVVSKLSNGQRIGEPQRLYDSNYILTPVNHDVTIQEDLYRVLTGQLNWGEWITRIGISVQTAITTEIYAKLTNSYDNLNASFKETGFDMDSFVQLAQRVSAANMGAKAVVFGTQVALSKVIPSADFSKYPYLGIGEEWAREGFMTRFAGVDMFLIDQRLVANDPNYNFAISDDMLYVISVGTDKPVKIGFEGEPIVNQLQPQQTADSTFVYSYQHRWAADLITSAKYGLIKLA